jgi:hypothetical protein
MRHQLLGLILFFLVSGHPSGSEAAFGGIQLLDGYSAKRGSWAVDAMSWTIEGKSGLKIYFEAGPNEGSWANPEERSKYSWYREQRIRGRGVRYALVKLGLKTQWEPDESRGLPLGNILLVTFLLGGEKSDHTANFSAKVANSEELADALLMVVTFDPSKGKF